MPAITGSWGEAWKGFRGEDGHRGNFREGGAGAGELPLPCRRLLPSPQPHSLPGLLLDWLLRPRMKFPTPSIKRELDDTVPSPPPGFDVLTFPPRVRKWLVRGQARGVQAGTRQVFRNGPGGRSEGGLNQEGGSQKPVSTDFV